MNESKRETGKQQVVQPHQDNTPQKDLLYTTTKHNSRKLPIYVTPGNLMIIDIT
jgi:hypothetical protein